MKKARFVLYPVSMAYGAAVKVRHWLYDAKILRSAAFNFPIICVGNLALGGTGKTPMVEMLIRLLKDRYRVATLSRGYKRKTKGYAKASVHTTALEIGDEPMQFHEKFPEVVVAVAEERVVGIPQILFDHPETQVIILDDALQHRPVKAGFNILLTEYENPFSADHLFPAGNLRDLRSRAHTANMIVVTKCPSTLTFEEASKMAAELATGTEQTVYFSALEYANPTHLFTAREMELAPEMAALIVSGIANPAPLSAYLRTQIGSYNLIRFNDHHIFTTDDLKNIKRDFDGLPGQSKIIITTEKDGVRLKKFEKEIGQLPIYVLPVRHALLFDKEAEFEKQILDFVDRFPAAGGKPRA